MIFHCRSGDLWDERFAVQLSPLPSTTYHITSRFGLSTMVSKVQLNECNYTSDLQFRGDASIGGKGQRSQDPLTTITVSGTAAIIDVTHSYVSFKEHTRPA